MKRLIGSMLALGVLGLGPSWGQSVVAPCVTSFVAGTGASQQNCARVTAGNPLPVTGTLALSGTQAVNVTQVLGAVHSAANPIFVTPGTGAAFAVTGTFWQATQPVSLATAPALVASSAIIGNVRIDQTTDGTTNLVAAKQSGTWTVVTPAPVGISPTDRTVTSATGASQTVMAANAARRTLTLVNTGNANCGVNPTGGTAVIGGAGTITLVSMGSYSPRVPTLAAVTAICTAAQPLYADEG